MKAGHEKSTTNPLLPDRVKEESIEAWECPVDRGSKTAMNTMLCQVGVTRVPSLPQAT